MALGLGRLPFVFGAAVMADRMALVGDI